MGDSTTEIAKSVFEKEGIGPLVRKGSSRLWWNQIALRISPTVACGLWKQWYRVLRERHRYRRRRNPVQYTDADPYKRILVDSSCIETRFDFSNVDRYSRLFSDHDPHRGLVVGGDWDANVIRFRDRPLYETLEERFVEGKSWEEINRVQKAMDALDSGRDDVWTWGRDTRAEFIAKCEYMEKLHRQIERNGYQSQYELVAKGKESFPLRDPVVLIGRDGELIHYKDGNHRLTLAKLLEEPITVQFGLRHRRWQTLRDEVRRGDNFSLRDREGTHPDLQDLV